MITAAYRNIFWFCLLGSTQIPFAMAHDACSQCHINAEPHEGNAQLNLPRPGLCIQCHPERVGKSEHVINVAVSVPLTVSLPLLNGQVSCTTCHDPHSKAPALVRYENEILCAACHRN